MPATRRDFLKQATAGAGGLAAGTFFSAEAAAGPRDKDVIIGMSRALLEVVRQRFAAHDLAGDIKDIEGDIVGNLAGSTAVQAVPLTNADEPDFVFVAE